MTTTEPNGEEVEPTPEPTAEPTGHSLRDTDISAIEGGIEHRETEITTAEGTAIDTESTEAEAEIEKEKTRTETGLQ
jgi:hypothetical protein